MVDTWGPVSNGSVLGPFNTATIADTSWQILAENIRSKFQQDPPCANCV